MINWTYLDRKGPSLVGFITLFADNSDPSPVKAQFNRNYAHGGGWFPIEGFEMDNKGVITFAGDPPLYPVAMGTIHDETIYVYPFAFVAIVQKDGSFEVARMD